MTITNQKCVPSHYSDYDSLLQFYNTCINHYRDNVLIRYKLPGTFEFRALTYNQVDIIVTHMAMRWKTMLHTSKKRSDSNVKDKNDMAATNPCMALFADSPIQALLTFFAMLKLGFIYLPISTQNTEDAILHLLKISNASLLIGSKANREMAIKYADKLRARDGVYIQVDDGFDVEQIISKVIATDFKPTTVTGNNENEENDSPNTDKHQTTTKADPLDTVFYVHTSGSTGIPKLIPLNTRSTLYPTMGGSINLNHKHDNSASNLFITSTDVFLFPIILTSAAQLALIVPVMLAGSSMLLFDHEYPRPSERLELIKMFNVTWMLAVPSILERLAEYLKSLDDATIELNSKILKRLKFCFSYGTQLQIPIGDYLWSKGLHVLNMYGATEILYITSPNLINDSDRWNNVIFTPELMRYATFEHYHDDLYHLIINRDFPSLAKGFGNRSNGDYETKDLFIKNSQDKMDNNWTLVGRMDDVLNINLGTKVTPGPMENEIRNEDIVQQCIVIGNNRERTSVLVELNYDKAINYSPVQMVSKVYNAVKRANTRTTAKGTIVVPDLVHILPLDKQLPRTRKEGVKRKETMVEFEQEIEMMYKNYLARYS